MHIDDDTVLPADMVWDEAHFADERTSAVSYGIQMGRTGDVESLVDFEFALWSHWRLFRARFSTAWFCHGIIGLWRRERFEQALEQHPFLPFGEDGWLGMVTLGQGYRIAQELRSAVLTGAPPQLLPGWCCRLPGWLPGRLPAGDGDGRPCWLRRDVGHGG